MVMRFKHDLACPECTKMLLDHGGSPKDIVNSTCEWATSWGTLPSQDKMWKPCSVHPLALNEMPLSQPATPFYLVVHGIWVEMQSDEKPINPISGNNASSLSLYFPPAMSNNMLFSAGKNCNTLLMERKEVPPTVNNWSGVNTWVAWEHCQIPPGLDISLLHPKPLQHLWFLSPALKKTSF